MKFKELTDIQEVKNLIEEYNNGDFEYVALDCETTGLDKHTDSILSFTLSGSKSGQAYFIAKEGIEFLALLNKPLVLHNFKFDFHMFARSGIDLRWCGLLYCTLILDHLLDENNGHSLDDIVTRRYNDTYKEVFWETYKTYEEAPREAQVEYACKDVLYTDKVCQDTLAELKQAGIPQALIEHVNKLALVLYDTELNGICVDLPYVSKVGDYLREKIDTLKHTMRKEIELECELIELDLYDKELEKRKTLKGRSNVPKPYFNFDSSAQLGALLYDHLKLPVQLSKKRARTVDDDALSKLEGKHPIIPLIREYKGHQKVFTSFIEGTLEKVRDGKVYPHFNPSGTVTGRISSSQPNLQQLPTSGGVRGIYVPKEGYSFVSADYKQLEVTLAAHFSRDSNLLKIIFDGDSQHDITARGLNIPRPLAKSINFSLQYGAGVRKVRSVLNCSEEEAQRAYDNYWKTYSGLKRFIDTCHKHVDSGLPVTNPFGRQRHFPKEFSNHWEKEHAKRQAPNALIQGTGSDCTSHSVYTVDKELREKDYGKVLFSVHDELLIEVKDDTVDESREILKNVMVGTGKLINLTVPLTVEVSGPMKRWED